MGDEAMYQAFTLHAPGPVTVVHHSGADLLVPASDLGAHDVVLTGLVYGRGIRQHLKALREFLTLVSTARHFAVIGADMMDGIYNERAAARRFRLAAIAAELGVESRILGFSWVDEPAALAKRALRRSPAAVALLARDPVSARRLRRDGGRSVHEVADLAFLTKPADVLTAAGVEEWLDSQAALARPVVLVNANPRIAVKYPGQDRAYTDLVRTLVEAGYACLALAHDARHGDDGEPAYLRSLLSEFADSDRVFVTPGVVLPGEVSLIASRCVLAVSGRMHLVILAAVGGTPTVGLEYQDKFEGLYGYFGYDLRVPAGDVRTELPRAVFAALDGQEGLREQLVASSPTLRELATKNLPA
ncbi:polysaccharide pyruvyl transferase family protein [Microbacterium sp. Root61]|uniref:polysaccharide pyruvyl transferase family protein n=1 Tax=Microbacterium sp. Root61 TaxID=1736570 RepID=UPI00138F00EB|nr:polysaccharide pyruvyl transferase family protein [Microbacterium sp. Root61]